MLATAACGVSFGLIGINKLQSLRCRRDSLVAVTPIEELIAGRNQNVKLGLAGAPGLDEVDAAHAKMAGSTEQARVV